MEEKTVPCTWCGRATTFTGTKHCDPCYELDKRISDSPQLAARIAGYYSADKDIPEAEMIHNIKAGRQQAALRGSTPKGNK